MRSSAPSLNLEAKPKLKQNPGALFSIRRSARQKLEQVGS